MKKCTKLIFPLEVLSHGKIMIKELAFSDRAKQRVVHDFWLF